MFVSVGSSRPARKIDGSLPSASLPSPPLDSLPMKLLNQEPYFGQLLTMLEKLSKLDLVALKIVSVKILWLSFDPCSAQIYLFSFENSGDPDHLVSEEAG